MKPETQTLLVHAGCIALIALCTWLALQIHGTGETELTLRAALIGSALFLYGKLGFKPASPVLDRIVERLAQKEPERVQRLTQSPPPPAAPVEVVRPVVTLAKPDGTPIDQEPKA